MWIEFKEKPFETAFVGELRLRTNMLYAPDQCDENFLGFDAVAGVPWEFLPEFFPYVRHRKWRRFSGLSANELSHVGQRLNCRLPPFKMNLFIQFKRPEYLVRRSAGEWAHWKQNYFRCWIDANQQALLSRIASLANGRAASVYASPAFYKKDDFFKHMANNNIVESSNILSAPMLDGHSKYTYCEPGSRGIGHSEPKPIESESLESILSLDERGAELQFTAHLKDSAALIESLFKDDAYGKRTLNLARKAILGADTPDEERWGPESWINALVTIVAFSAAFEIRCCAIG